MTIARVWQAGAEMQSKAELPAESANWGSASGQSISATKAKTGLYSFRFGADDFPLGFATPSVAQVRCGAWFNHAGLTGTNARGIFFHFDNSGGLNTVEYYQTTGVLRICALNTEVVSVAAATAGINPTNTWFHVGVHAKFSGGSPFISVYINGVLRLQATSAFYTGNCTGIYVGGRGSSAGNGWANYLYVDDIYGDTTVSEADDSVPQSIFEPLTVSGAGTNTNWSVAGAATNYQAVDDTGAPNDTTDYVYASASGVNDGYAMSNLTLPAGYQIDAVIVEDWIKKSDPAKASTIKLGTRLSGTEVLGSAQALTTTFGPVMERQTTKPGGGAWSATDVNNMEIVHETAGTF